MATPQRGNNTQGRIEEKVARQAGQLQVVMTTPQKRSWRAPSWDDESDTNAASGDAVESKASIDDGGGRPSDKVWIAVQVKVAAAAAVSQLLPAAAAPKKQRKVCCACQKERGIKYANGVSYGDRVPVDDTLHTAPDGRHRHPFCKTNSYFWYEPLTPGAIHDLSDFGSFLDRYFESYQSAIDNNFYFRLLADNTLTVFNINDIQLKSKGYKLKSGPKKAVMHRKAVLEEKFRTTEGALDLNCASMS